jgi:pimeloyl-ACP methyl ester carboxylesterase
MTARGADAAKDGEATGKDETMRAIGYLRRAVEVLQENWRATRAPADPRIAGNLARLARERKAGPRPGLDAYLRDHPALGAPRQAGEWRRQGEEWRLGLENDLFGPAEIRLMQGPGRDVVVFLPGYAVGASQVWDEPEHLQCMRGFCQALGAGLCAWTWPLQRERGAAGMYRGLRTVLSLEREYARVLPALGTCLWRELVEELRLALFLVRERLGPEARLHVVGWSMGGAFAYAAPLLGTPVRSVVAAGSLARMEDLLAQGGSRVHGFFFYPLHGLAYFDIEDLAAAVLAKGVPLAAVHGDRDHGCLEASADAMRAAAGRSGPGAFRHDVLPDHGHSFSPRMKECVAAALRPHLEHGGRVR